MQYLRRFGIVAPNAIPSTRLWFRIPSAELDSFQLTINFAFIDSYVWPLTRSGVYLGSSRENLPQKEIPAFAGT